VFEQDLLHFSSKIIRRHCGRRKFHIKLRLARGTILKNTLLKKNFTSALQTFPYFILLFLYLSSSVSAPRPHSRSELFAKPLS